MNPYSEVFRISLEVFSSEKIPLKNVKEFLSWHQMYAGREKCKSCLSTSPLPWKEVFGFCQPCPHSTHGPSAATPRQGWWLCGIRAGGSGQHLSPSFLPSSYPSFPVLPCPCHPCTPGIVASSPPSCSPGCFLQNFHVSESCSAMGGCACNDCV